MLKTVSIKITGIVQGVGFRPFIYRLAVEEPLTGYVINIAATVLIEVTGNPSNIESFISRISAEKPSNARIDEIYVTELPLKQFSEFKISASVRSEFDSVVISPDLAICDRCREELFEPKDYRYRYPFINCTACGPRFTIIESLPYDRKTTTMRPFEMCPVCLNDYQNPLSRRFHAQPNACGLCGPSLSFLEDSERVASGEEAIALAVKRLRAGEIVAIKGMGGFNLACDPFNDTAVALLRKKKERSNKPFALMAKDLESISRFCKISPEEAALLKSPKAPILLLKKGSGAELLSKEVAAYSDDLGFMLCYTPLHLLLFEKLEHPLVMTSANISGDFLCYSDDEMDQIEKITRFVLTYNRKILIGIDDSVVRMFHGAEFVQRRARGYSPASIKTPFSSSKKILALGADLKNSIALFYGSDLNLSQHIGDLNTAYPAYDRILHHMLQLFNFAPELIACDMHPEYISTAYSFNNFETPILQIQHHHAHMASCMVEHSLTGDCIGIIFDGLGMGEDGNLWGGEFLVGSYKNYIRAAHFKNFSLPGGDLAALNPWRSALSLLFSSISDFDFEDYPCELPKLSDSEKKILKSLILHPNIVTSSVGRIFDAVAALTGFSGKITYEGEAAIALERLAASVSTEERYDFELLEDSILQLDLAPTFRSILKELHSTPPQMIAAKFHNTLSEVILTVALRLRREYGLDRVILSGGVFQNMLLLEKSYSKLAGAGFSIFVHSQIPTNDGGISSGQAAIAAERSN